MNKRQIKICKDVIKYKKLEAVLERNNIGYREIQDILGCQNLTFSDAEMDGNTTVALSAMLIEEVEKFNRYAMDKWITRIIAIVALIIAILK